MKNLLQTTDAKIWTEEFLASNLDAKDFGVMIGWFANAIMTGMDHQRWKDEKIIAFCVGLISTMDQFSNKHPEDVKQWILDEVEKVE